MLAYSSLNIKQQTIQTIVCISAMLKHNLWSQDTSQAYLQSSSLLSKDVYVQSKHGTPLQSVQILKPLNPFYGLAESCNYWHNTMKQHLKRDLNMTQTIGYWHALQKCNTDSWQVSSEHVLTTPLEPKTKSWKKKAGLRSRCSRQNQESTTFILLQVSV